MPTKMMKLWRLGEGEVHGLVELWGLLAEVDHGLVLAEDSVE
jgi:hypothetical protein